MPPLLSTGWFGIQTKRVENAIEYGDARLGSENLGACKPKQAHQFENEQCK